MPYKSLLLREFHTYQQPSTRKTLTFYNAALTPNLYDEKEKTSLYFVLNDVPTILCTFIPFKYENQPLFFQIDLNSKISFYTLGPNDIDLLYFEED
ncbi:hypothetical protein CWI38_0241p0010 [Hamiltosporidium tvaerminnensis]|uniref:Nucleoplasmin-like domain-containing protein n=1 Tax=Hamiltosporidium tvaerminnensis TaxID=1176355 RepID=A0A4Q9M237_9MICR|nr:hypothetical protein CWI38_0241p0010 [Hamiltosporidium tvaerminnensis]